MHFRIIASTAALALLGSVAIASANSQVGIVPNTAATLTGVQLADNDDNPSPRGSEVWDWYQGHRGHWRQDRDNGRWRWFGADEDEQNEPWEWYQGYRGHWKNEHNGWHFYTPELVCNNNGNHCKTGREIPPNGEGMVSRRNQKLFWHCDSEGHHCDWAKRPGM